MKPQWYVSCNSMAKGALDAVKSKKIEIIPSQYEQDWYRYFFFLYFRHANIFSTNRVCPPNRLTNA